MLESLKQAVYEQNVALMERGLVKLTWGNVSAIDRGAGMIIIKPSGVDYSIMRPEDMVVVNLNGEVVEGTLPPSCDTPTHLELYRQFADIGAIVHTHSTYATAWAQAGRFIPVYGTTHADVFSGPVPCTRELKKKEVENNYELNTGKVIAAAFKGINHTNIPAVLVKNHGAFIWGASSEEALKNAVTLEEVAKLACLTESLIKSPEAPPVYLVKKHFGRKHGC